MDRKDYGIVYRKAQIYHIIKSLEFSYQKDKGFFPEKDIEKIEAFKTALKKLLEQSADPVLLYEDECSMSDTVTVTYQWAKKGKQPKIQCKQRQRERQTVFGSYNYDSGQITVSFADRGNGHTFKKTFEKGFVDL